MDPISIGLLLASLASSTAGGAMKNSANSQDYIAKLGAETEQAKQATAEAAARNGVLQDFQTGNAGRIASNQTSLGDTIAAFSPEAQNARVAASTAQRQGAISGAIGTLDPSHIAGANTPGLTADGFKTAFADAGARAHASGDARGALGAVGDVNTSNNGAISQGARDINTTNTISRSAAANLPGAQDLAGFQTKKIIPLAAPVNQGVGNLLQGIGNTLGSAAGAGVAKGFSMPKVNIPGFNPIAGVAG